MHDDTDISATVATKVFFIKFIFSLVYIYIFILYHIILWKSMYKLVELSYSTQNIGIKNDKQKRAKA